MPSAGFQVQHDPQIQIGPQVPVEPVLGSRPPRVQPDGVEAGLLLFFKRPSLLQSWAEFFGHEWRHVGITVRTDDGVQIATYGPKVGFRIDDPIDVLQNYTRVGAARVYSSPAETDRLDRWVAEVQTRPLVDAPYVVSAPLIGPLHLMARRSSRPILRWLLMLIVNLYCTTQTKRHKGREAYVCSTFVWAALRASRSTPLHIPLSSHPDDDVAYARPEVPADVRLGRWLCGPTELWNAIATTDRWEVDLTRWKAV